MKKKSVIKVLGALTCSLIIFALFGVTSDFENSRAPASFPNNYEQLTACEKQDILWKNITDTTYSELPAFRSFGAMELLTLSKQEIALKGSHHSDFAPVGWKKLLHGRGAIAKVKLIPRSHRFTGIFRGADCALLRLSITFKPSGNKAVAPGLAFKVLRDGVESSNISALVSLSGQEKDFNFFKHPLSNIVPIGSAFGEKLVHRIFHKVSNSPEELLANDLARIDSKGIIADQVVAPRQLFFVPEASLGFSSDEHDIRNDFLTIAPGTVIYRIYAASERLRDFDYMKYQRSDEAAFLKDADYVADIVTTSSFAASAFGDDGIFFHHELKY